MGVHSVAIYHTVYGGMVRVQGAGAGCGCGVHGAV